MNSMMLAIRNQTPSSSDSTSVGSVELDKRAIVVL
jgi:hypothetical protein